jgi:hypothetical protein
MKCNCKNICKDFEGYEPGYFHFAVEGKKWCGGCNYKIITTNSVCPCCKGNYRVVPNNNKSRQLRTRQEHIATISI